MENALEQARERHTYLQTGRYTYNPGSFRDSVDANNAPKQSHLVFDLTTANPEDMSMSREEYRDILPKLRTLTLTSEPNTPSLYAHTPNVLLGFAPYLRFVNICRVNRFDIPIIEKMFPLLKKAMVQLHLDQLQMLTERNPSSFQNVSKLKMDITDYDSVESLRLLHEWASSNYNLELDLYIRKWTVPLQNQFSQLSDSLHSHKYNKKGLSRFSIMIGEIEVFNTKSDFWNRFISETTEVMIYIKNVPHTTRSTVTWLSEMLNNFMKSSSDVMIFMTLHCDDPDWKELIDPLLVHFVERVRDAYLKANNLQVIPDRLADNWERSVFSQLHITLNVPVLACVPHHNTNRNKWTAFTRELEQGLFNKSRVDVTVHQMPDPRAKKQRITEEH